MAFTLSHSAVITMLVISVAASMLGTSMASRNRDMTGGGWGGRGGWGGGRGARWNFGPWSDYNSTNCPFSHQNRTRGGAAGGGRGPGPNKIVVGGSNNWNFGFNYTDWSLKNGPFNLNDILVFKYAAPVNGSPGHSVYLLPDFWSFLNCDLRRAKRLASPTQGGGDGFEFKLTRWQPYYFACGEHNGIHCNLGMMKFFVMPIFRY